MSFQSGSFSPERGDLSGELPLPGRGLLSASGVVAAAGFVRQDLVLDRESCCVVNLVNFRERSVSGDQAR